MPKRIAETDLRMNARPDHDLPDAATPHAHADLLKRERRRRPLAWWLSWLLAVAAAGSIIAFLWQSGIIFQKRKVPPKVEVTVLDQGTILVRNADITGTDEEDLPFEIRARISKRLEKKPGLVHLEAVTGVLRKKNGDQIHLESDRAVYDTRTETATLLGNVHIYTPGKFDLRTTEARIEVPKKRFVVDAPVRVLVDDGEIRAGGMHTARNSDRVFFTGRVHATFGTGQRLEQP